MFNPFQPCRRISTYLQQTTFENIMAKGEIAHDEQFLHFPQCFQLYTFNSRDFPNFSSMCFFKVFCCRFVVGVKGLIKRGWFKLKNMNIPQCHIPLALILLKLSAIFSQLLTDAFWCICSSWLCKIQPLFKMHLHVWKDKGEINVDL